jgi:hypothetical protein
MLEQVDEFDGSCLSVIAERKRQWQQQHGEDERGISTGAILSRLGNWVIGGRQGRECVPEQCRPQRDRPGVGSCASPANPVSRLSSWRGRTRAAAARRSPGILKHLH